MKGVVFTEFLEMVEEEFSLEVADKIIDSSDLESGGAYTTIGTYDHEELIQLVDHLSEELKVPKPELMMAFGKRLFGHFVNHHGNFFTEDLTAFKFLLQIEDYIHVEVKKLYPDAELPTFEYDQSDDKKLVMTYSSRRPFADLAHGLLVATFEHFGEQIAIMREDLADNATSARFTLIP